MVASLTYLPGTGDEDRQPVDLYSSQCWIGSIPELRTVEWDYDVTPGNLTGVTRPAVERHVKLICTNPAILDSMRAMFDADLLNRTPGTLTVNGEWSHRCYLTASEPDETSPSTVTAQLTIVLLDGVWRRDADTIQCVVHQGDSGNTWLDLPFDLPFDLQAPRMSASVTNTLPYGVKWRMIVYGPASNPRVSIGGNEIMVDVLVPDGGYLTIDAIARTVVLTAANGDVTNVFGKARRGIGQGSGTYVFEPIAPGTSVIEWDGSFGFDLTPVEERSVPPWSTLS